MTALVTGGGSGLGRDIDEMLAEHDANIAVCSRKFNNCQETIGAIVRKHPVNAQAYACDVSSEEDVNRTVEAVLADFEQIDILVNNAGVIRDNLVFKMTDDDWDMVMDVHLKGAFYACQAAQAYMTK